MRGKELADFGGDPWCGEMCRLRVWDDEAKVQGLQVRSLESWRCVIERQLEDQRRVADGEMK